VEKNIHPERSKKRKKERRLKMKASEVIEQLEKLMEKYGDLECQYEDGDFLIGQIFYIGDGEIETFRFC
jgi:hypothetical protein